MGDVAVAQAQIRAVLAHPDKQRLKVLEIEQAQALFVSNPEGDVQDAFLRFAQLEEPRQQERTHLGDRGAHRVALLAEEIPEGDRKGAVGVIVEAYRARTLGEGVVELEAGAAAGGEAREIALDVRQDHRHPLG